MTRLHEQVAFIRLEPLTPIHIGTGDRMDPLSYIMKEEGESKKYFLYPVDVPAWVETHPDPVALADLFARNSLPEIRSYLARELSPLVDVYGGAPARVISRDVYAKYSQELTSRDSFNQLLIDPAVKNPLTGALIIPGSSIKGAIRTAVIDWLDINWNVRLKEKGKTENTLQEVLGRVSENAFRNLKVGDFPAALGESLIVTAKEVRKRYNPAKQGTPKNPCEISLSRVMSGEKYAIYGKIAVGAHGGRERDQALTVSWQGKRQAWTLEQLMELCNHFYGQRYRAEHDRFYTQPHLAHVAEHLAKIDALNIPPGSMLLRLGHYSHVECMTVTHNQPQTRRLRGGTFMPSGTTRTLADGAYPFGWARLSIIGAEEYAQACARREKCDAAFLAERVRRRADVVEEREAQARREAQRAQAEQERQEAEARLQAELAAMSPEERLLAAVESESVNENQVVELFGQLDDLDAALRQRAARAMRTFWEKEGKWEKKQCTKKQWAKVQKVRNILEKTSE